MPYLSTLSIKNKKKNLRRAKIGVGRGGGSRVGMTAVRDSMVFKASLKNDKAVCRTAPATTGLLQKVLHNVTDFPFYQKTA